jgi:hypothetical protein
MNRGDFTLVPYGGLGNRINAICSAIVFCQEHSKSLRIIWFRDQGLNCPSEDLFSLSPMLKDVTIREATFSDYIMRDRPRKRNLWIPLIFQPFLFDRRIYDKEASEVFSQKTKPNFGSLEKYKHVFMAGYSKLWISPDMWSYIIPNKDIISKVDKVTSEFGDSTIGLHIRRSDNIIAINQSPTQLFIEKMEQEIELNKDVRFYLASDSTNEKKKLKELFGDKIITLENDTNRNTKKGIIDAFTEILILSRTKKIYGSAQSSFSELAHLFSGNEFEILKKEQV